MYEETRNSIDWKGIFLKVIIAFLVVLIAVKGYTVLKSDNKKSDITTNATAESKSSSTFTENIEKLRNAGEKYYKENKDKLPKTEGNTTMITLKDLINKGVIENLFDEEGKTCDVESSYVTATLEGNKTKIKANLVCGDASSYSLVYMGENDSEVKTESTNTENKTTISNTTSNKSDNKTTVNENKTNVSNTNNSCGTSCGTPKVDVSTNTKVEQTVVVNKSETTPTTSTTPTPVVPVKYYTVTFNSNGGATYYASQTVAENNLAFDPGVTRRNGYRFMGWYLDGTKYDFNTPVTRNITLVAKFVSDDVYNWNIYDDYNIYDNYNSNDYNNGLLRDTETVKVYSIAWLEEGTNDVSVTHTLRVPEEIEKLEKRYGYDIEKIRIKATYIDSAITSNDSIINWRANHKNTFLYSNNGWENKSIGYKNLAKISTRSSDTTVEPYTEKFVDYEDALDNGFEVTWSTDNVLKQCQSPFFVTGPDGVTDYNNCGYGLIYSVTFEYLYYE